MLHLVLGLALSAANAAAPARAAYVGSARCASCHKRQAELWRTDWHARALAKPSHDTVVASFEPALRYERGGTRAEPFKEGGAWLMKAEIADGGYRPFPISWVIGGRRMQDFLAMLPGGRLQTLPIYWHATGKGEWVDYTTLKQGSLTTQHPFFWASFILSGDWRPAFD